MIKDALIAIMIIAIWALWPVKPDHDQASMELLKKPITNSMDNSILVGANENISVYTDSTGIVSFVGCVTAIDKTITCTWTTATDVTEKVN